MSSEKQIFQEQADDDSLKFCKTNRLDDDRFNKKLLTDADVLLDNGVIVREERRVQRAERLAPGAQNGWKGVAAWDPLGCRCPP